MEGMSYVPTTVSVSLNFKDTARALAFYTEALGAKELHRLEHEGCVWHAEMVVGNTRVYLSDENGQWGAYAPETVGGCPVLLCVEAEDPDALQARAVAAGAQETMPVADMPWGARSGNFVDPFGYRWSVGRQIEEVPPEEIIRRMQAAGE